MNQIMDTKIDPMIDLMIDQITVCTARTVFQKLTVPSKKSHL